MASYEIRVLTADDVVAFHEARIEAVTNHPEAFLVDPAEERARSREQVAERLVSDENRFVLGALADGKVVGMVGFVRETRPKIRHKAFIWGTYVAPSVRGKGVGRALMVELMDRARTMDGLRLLGLSVMASNHQAAGLYESLGFKKWGVEPCALVVDGRDLDEAHLTFKLE